ncbi:MAG: malto-oligosyltrehalose trehalohydrolase [Gemmataceae bacterium]
MRHERRYPIGAEVLPQGGAHFRVWAPKRQRVDVVLDGGAAFPLLAEGGGYFSGAVAAAGPGMLYRFRLDGEENLYPDPASRFQPAGPHGPSEVIDPAAYRWTCRDWPGVKLEGQIIYELHVGTFTPEGTFEAAAAQFAELAAAGITLLEVMPVADFPGRFGWGYDGVNLFAPCRLYGRPDDFRRFADRAHAAGLGVILDVVYNHVGPDGNYLGQFSDHYLTKRHENEWGDAINFDDPDSGPVREFFIANAGYWIDEFHLDGLRLDATQSIIDTSKDHVVATIGRRARQAADGRPIVIVAENEPQDTTLVRPLDRGGYGLDALWNDDFHHAARVAATGHAEAYYTDYHGTPQEFISAAKWGYLYQGQLYSWQQKRRGTPALDLPPAQFITFLDNHDQLANSGHGLPCRLLASPGRYKALTALTLLAPSTPMLFQGQEFGSTKPFFYFADHSGELAALVNRGRREFLAQFPSLDGPEAQVAIPDPADPETFRRCVLDFAERQANCEIYDLHRDLLRLRREDSVFRSQRHRGVDGAVLGPQAFALRFFADDGLDRLLLVNLGPDLRLREAPEPLLAPPAGCAWELHWSSEHVRYGGNGTPPLDVGQENWRVAGEEGVVAPRPKHMKARRPENWLIPGEEAVVLVPRRVEQPGDRRPSGR